MNKITNEQTLIKQCLYCKEKAFRRLDIYDDYILWKCKSCGKTVREKLFQIHKKIIYLDQLAYSLVLKSSIGNKQDKWQELGKKIGQLVEDQIVVCPYSTTHQTETELYKKYIDEMTELYRKFSQGIAFKHPFYIEKYQLYNSLRNFFFKKQSRPYESIWQHALSRDPHRWSSRFSIFVNISIDLDKIEKRRILKKETCVKMQKHYDDILKKEKKTFEQDFDIEKTFLADVILNNHEKNIKLYRSIMMGRNPRDAILDLLNDHLEWIIPQINAIVGRKVNPLLVLKKFLKSDEFYQTPYVYIWSYLFAALNQKVRTSSRRAKQGDYDDIEAISHYLPYCDLILIDNEFRALLEERGAPLIKKFKAIVFSGKILTDLFELFQKWTSASKAEDIRKIYKSLDHTSLF